MVSDRWGIFCCFVKHTRSPSSPIPQTPYGQAWSKQPPLARPRSIFCFKHRRRAAPNENVPSPPQRQKRHESGGGVAPALPHAPPSNRGRARVIHEAVRGWPFCRKSGVYPFGIFRRKMNIFWYRENFFCEPHDIVAPQPESQNWPSEGCCLAISHAFGLRNFKLQSPPMTSSLISGKMSTLTLRNVPLQAALLAAGAGAAALVAATHQGGGNSLNEVAHEKFHRGGLDGVRNVSDTAG